MMSRFREIVAGGTPQLAAGMLLVAVAGAVIGRAPTAAAHTRGAQLRALTHPRAFAPLRSALTPRSLLQSSELWATVNVCNSVHHPDTIGIRGSMPGDGHAHDAMYMRFLVQSLDATTGKWANIGRSADSGFIMVGSGAVTRQAGRSFEFKPTASTYTLRGLVEFQWHHAGRTAHVTTRTTTSGHTSLAGAEPKGFSAATCALP